MRPVEKVLVVFAFIGIVMQLFNIPGGHLLVMFGLAALSAFYLLFTWLLIRDTISRRNYLVLALPLGIVLANASIAILYKLQFWPGRSQLLMMGIVLIVPLIFITRIIYLRNKISNEEKANAFNKAAQRLIPFFFVTATLFIIPDRDIIGFMYRDDPERARLYTRAVDDPFNEQYQNDLVEYELNKYFNGDKK